MSRPADQPDFSAPTLFVGTSFDSTIVAVPGPSTMNLLDVQGIGILKSMFIQYVRTAGSTPPTGLYLRIIIDGITYTFELQEMGGWVDFTINTPTDVVFTEWDATLNLERFRWNWRIPLKFTSRITVQAVNGWPVGNNMTARGYFFLEAMRLV